MVGFYGARLLKFIKYECNNNGCFQSEFNQTKNLFTANAHKFISKKKQQKYPKSILTKYRIGLKIIFN